MPRRSSASLSVISPTGIPLRLAPPADLDDAERDVFINTVGSKRPEAFEPSDLPLLAAYARAVVLEQRAAAALKTNGPVTADGKPSPWLAVLAQATKAMMTLSLRLRLSPQGRRSPDRPGHVPVLSVYEQMDLEREQDDAHDYVPPRPSWSRGP
jgi:hypothetical protein